MDRRRFLKSVVISPAAALFPCAAQQRGITPADPFRPIDSPNEPIGVARGIHPGRVVWLRDPAATSWDGATGRWWDDANTDQKAVNGLVSETLQKLTGQRNDRQAWDALFRDFNETHRSGTQGYRVGETIAIKINGNQDRSPEWGVPAAPGGRAGGPVRGPLNGLPSPHAVAALVANLILQGGVRGQDILVYDATGGRNIGEPIYSRIRANTDREFQAVRFLAGSDYGLGGRIMATPDERNPVRFSNAELPAAYLPAPVTAARYMINMALLRPHGMAGVTLIGKNHFGSVYFPNDGGWSPRRLHDFVMRTRPMGSYNPLVDLLGHQHLGNKTMLYMLDGIYTAAHNEGNVYRWESLGDAWASSILASQDPIALDSVGLDILRAEPRATEVRGNVDNYLHEAAQAANPPSGIVYHPDTRSSLPSLGVHEHWNSARERKYSRNLGRKEGIELIAAV